MKCDRKTPPPPTGGRGGVGRGPLMARANENNKKKGPHCLGLVARVGAAAPRNLFPPLHHPSFLVVGLVICVHVIPALSFVVLAFSSPFVICHSHAVIWCPCIVVCCVLGVCHICSHTSDFCRTSDIFPPIFYLVTT